MLIEGCRLGCSLVEEGIIGDWGIDGGRERGDERLFAACGGGHGGMREREGRTSRIEGEA